MNNIILVGYMGCGKSTIGIKLSYRLQQPFLDTDKMIENKQDKTISDIFAQLGEESFRQMETDTIRGLLDEKRWYVIATGGGLCMREENRKILKKLGKVVYLRVQPKTVYERLKNDTTRPLLQGENPYQKIQDMIALRGPVYEEVADLIVDVDGLSFEQIMRKIEEIA